MRLIEQENTSLAGILSRDFHKLSKDIAENNAILS
jgi:hypothetical protein